jgi:hypothetical protein
MGALRERSSNTSGSLVGAYHALGFGASSLVRRRG